MTAMASASYLRVHEITRPLAVSDQWNSQQQLGLQCASFRDLSVWKMQWHLQALQRFSCENRKGKGEQSSCFSCSTRNERRPPVNESIEVPKGGPSFRFKAEVNMWPLEFEVSGLRVLADPWFVGNQTFWDQDWLYIGRS